ncbi:sigma-54 interaction domain-containing protein [Leucothrix mucor]|uniref:sigma-54 interaction domain-containing protein n=1 Tax=Leucothrix mucor TaxID=45248 RepID=UPI0003B50265|nr:sigma-54 dependent transcriptional regulator [Leucothrix mucor]
MNFDHILTCSSAMSDTLSMALCIAKTDANALITGESGTGKELIAKAIHASSARSKAAFVTVNCATLPEALAESILFGHRKGAFTGANESRSGLISSADGGVLFLDEIGELSLPVQAKLLRFLESGEVLPLGEMRPRKVNVRVLAATHRNLYQHAEAGQFRHDLFYRLNVIPLTLPPLSERKGDIRLLGQHFLQQFAVQHKLQPATLTPAAIRVMEGQRWQGNVRELRNYCERLSIFLAGRDIHPANLPSCAGELAAPAKNSGFHLPKQGISLEAVERDLLNQALHRTCHNKSRAAGLLGISRDALNYRIKKYALV